MPTTSDFMSSITASARKGEHSQTCARDRGLTETEGSYTYLRLRAYPAGREDFQV